MNARLRWAFCFGASAGLLARPHRPFPVDFPRFSRVPLRQTGAARVGSIPRRENPGDAATILQGVSMNELGAGLRAAMARIASASLALAIGFSLYAVAAATMAATFVVTTTGHHDGGQQRRRLHGRPVLAARRG